MRYLLKLITVEPSLLIFLVTFECLNDLNTNLYLQKSCRFDQTHEPDLDTKCDDEERGLLFVSEAFRKFSSVMMLLNSLLPIFVLPWSDKAGRRRRPLIFIPIIGIMLQALTGCVNSFFWHWTPVAAAITVSLFGSMGGGLGLIMPACQMYICDVCEVESRTTRLGFLGAIQLISLILGKGGSGFILHRFGFLYSYLLCFASSTVALIIGSILIKDKSVAVEKEIPIGRMFTNIGRDMVENFRVVFRKSLGSKRIIVLMLLTSHVAVLFTYFGELSVLYQYLRHQFGWTERAYSSYMLYKFSTSALGIVFCSVVLSKFYKVHDGLIGILAASFDMLAILALFFATEPWQVYLIPLVDVFHGTVMSITISFMSKYYQPDELGRLYSIAGIFIMPMALSFTTYNVIFILTLNTFPSAFCLLSIALDAVILIGFCGAYFLSVKLNRSTDAEKSAYSGPNLGKDEEVPEHVLRQLKST